jgi:hypothetical protein
MLRLKMRTDAYSSRAREVRLKGRESLKIAALTELIDFVGIVVSNTLAVVLDRTVPFASATRSRTLSSNNTLLVEVLIVLKKR